MFFEKIPQQPERVNIVPRHCSGLKLYFTLYGLHFEGF